MSREHEGSTWTGEAQRSGPGKAELVPIGAESLTREAPAGYASKRNGPAAVDVCSLTQNPLAWSTGLSTWSVAADVPPTCAAGTPAPMAPGRIRFPLGILYPLAVYTVVRDPL